MTATGQQLIAMLKRDEDDICDAWRLRLSEHAFFEALRVVSPTANPLRPLLHDMVSVLDGHLPDPHLVPGIEGARRFEPYGIWRTSLCQCIEVFLTGEVVVRRWARAHLDATDSEFLEQFELLNRATHELIRSYSLRYCESCRAVAATQEKL